MSCEVWEPKA